MVSTRLSWSRPKDPSGPPKRSTGINIGPGAITPSCWRAGSGTAPPSEETGAPTMITIDMEATSTAHTAPTSEDGAPRAAGAAAVLYIGCGVLSSTFHAYYGGQFAFNTVYGYIFSLVIRVLGEPRLQTPKEINP